MSKSFRVLDAARTVADEVNRLLKDPHLSLIHQTQLRDSAQSVCANIRDGMGRAVGPDRRKSYRVARGEAEETDEHLRSNFADGRIREVAYWRLHNRLILVIKMLDALSTG